MAQNLELSNLRLSIVYKIGSWGRSYKEDLCVVLCYAGIYAFLLVKQCPWSSSVEGVKPLRLRLPIQLKAMLFLQKVKIFLLLKQPSLLLNGEAQS